MHLKTWVFRPCWSMIFCSIFLATLVRGDGGRARADQSPIVRPTSILSSWAGPYVGISFGGQESQANWATSGVSDGAGLNASMAPDPSTANARLGTRSLTTEIFSGYNWQLTRLILGIEGGVISSNSRKSIIGIPGTYGPVLRNDTAHIASDRIDFRLGTQGSARVRLGYLAAPDVLPYFTVGITARNIEVDGTCSIGSWCGDPHYSSGRWTRVGWTVGAGMEATFQDHWLARAEYRYADLGSITGTVFAATVDAVNYGLQLRTHTILTGLGYKFDERMKTKVSPSLLEVEPTSRWTGPYAGFSLGERQSRSNWVTTEVMEAPSISSFKRKFVIAPPGDIPTGVEQSTSRRLFDIINISPAAHIGYLWQLSPRWLVGIEGEVSSGSGDKTLPGLAGTFGTAIRPYKAGDTTTLHIGADADLLARLGFLVSPRLMVYGAGGASLLWITTTVDCSVAGHWCVKPHSDLESWTQLGWTAMGGVEAVLTDHLRARVEYRYSNFGKVSHTYFGATTDDLSADVTVRTRAMKIGLSYAFGV